MILDPVAVEEAASTRQMASRKLPRLTGAFAKAILFFFPRFHYPFHLFHLLRLDGPTRRPDLF